MLPKRPASRLPPMRILPGTAKMVVLLGTAGPNRGKPITIIPVSTKMTVRTDTYVNGELVSSVYH